MKLLTFANKKIIHACLFIAVLAIALLLSPQHVFAAININDTNIYDLNKMHNYYDGTVARMRTCDFDPAPPNPANHGASTSSWVSREGFPTNGGDDTIDSGVNTVNMQLNFVGHYCTANMTYPEDLSAPYPYDRANLKQKHLLNTRVNVGNPRIASGPSGLTLNDSGLRGQDMFLPWGSCYNGGNNYIVTGSSCNGAPLHEDFSISGFRNLPPKANGTPYEIVVDVPMRPTGQNEALDWICLKNNVPAEFSDGRDDPSGGNCPNTVSGYRLYITIRPQPTNWNYNTNITTRPSLSTSTPCTYKPAGSVVQLTSRTTNVGDGRGTQYDHQFNYRVGNGSWGQIRYRNNEGELNAGGGRTRSSNYRIPTNLAHGTTIYFRARIAPHAGQSTPSKTITSSGWEDTALRCLRVQKTFNLTPSLTANGFSNGSTLNNGDTRQLTLRITSANGNSRGSTRNIYGRRVVGRIFVTRGASFITGSATIASRSFANLDPGDSVTLSGSFTISDTTPVDSLICFRGGVTPDSSSNTSEQRTGEICVTTTYNIVPQLQALGSDVHAGGDQALNNNRPQECTVAGSGDIQFTDGSAEQSPTHSGELLVSAFGNIGVFGSSGRAPGDPLSDFLTLANRPAPKLGGYDTDPNYVCRIYTEGLYSGSSFNQSVIDYYDSVFRTSIEVLPNGSTIDFSRVFSEMQRVNSSRPPGQKYVNFIFYSEHNSDVSLVYSGSGTPEIPVNATVTIVAEHDIDIETDITIEDGNWQGYNMPSFGLISAKGGINIDPDVENLYGFYYANNTIDTCDGPNITNNATQVSRCSKPLYVRGMFAAEKYQFRRTTNPDTGFIAERIEYQPEMYLVFPPIIRQYSYQRFDAEKLQLQYERPPLF